MSVKSKSAIVVGAGPAGLAAADELVRAGRQVTVVEKDPQYVGGLARTVLFNGFRFDLGGHRYFSKNPEIRRWWEQRLGADFLVVQRVTSILYRGKYFDYPLRAGNALAGLGPFEAVRCVLSYFKAKIAPVEPEQSFEDWVCNRFGRRLFEIFFKTYTEKVWGLPCDKISLDWAAQRIRGLSLMSAILSGLGLRKGDKIIKTLIDSFHYPRRGCGMMWEKTRDDLAAAGAKVEMGQTVRRIVTSGRRIQAIETADESGNTALLSADDYITTMPLRELALSFDPPLAPEVRAAAEGLTYRDLLVVALIVDIPDMFPDHWVYIHDPSVRVGRIANFTNWSAEMAGQPGKSGLGLDYFCSQDDDLWNRSDGELLELARGEIEKIGLAPASAAAEGLVIRVPEAYPVLDGEYKSRVAIIRSALENYENLLLAGRNGMHKYNNQDHSMLTGILAARAAAGEKVDPWKVNIDAEYIEEESPEISDSARLIPHSREE